MKQCPICLELFARLVLDYDHRTGFARAEICERCHGWLEVLEADPERFLRRKRRTQSWRRWVIENAERIHSHLEQHSGVLYTEIKRARKAQRACEQGRDAVRIPLETGNGPVTTTPAGAGESRANKRSNSWPKAGGPCSQERLAWAREMLARAAVGCGASPRHGVVPKSEAVFASEESSTGGRFSLPGDGVVDQKPAKLRSVPPEASPFGLV